MHFRFKAFRKCLMFCGVRFEDWGPNDLKRPRGYFCKCVPEVQFKICRQHSSMHCAQ